MSSTYSTNLRLELQATGENRSTWGVKANTVFELLEEAITGSYSHDMADGNVVLTTNNGSTDTARAMMLTMTGTNTSLRSIRIPTVPKVYIVTNATSGGQHIIVTNGTNFVYVYNSESALVFTDGTEVRKLQTNMPNVTDGATLGNSTLQWSDLFLASGAVIDFANNNVRLIHSSGALALRGLWDISHSTSGQIKFPATQNPSSDTNTLDDYEEGTFTPTLTFGGASVGITYNGSVPGAGSRYGKYTKIGNSVNFSFGIVITSKGTSTGLAAISGFPFTASSGANSGGYCTSFSNLLTTTYPSAHIEASSSSILLIGDGAQITDANFKSTASLHFSGMMFV